jgi:hypothetical protein
MHHASYRKMEGSNRIILNKYSAKMEGNGIKKMNDEATGRKGER